MLVNRLMSLLSGYLIIRFKGERVERLINLCLQQEIPVWDIYTTRSGVVVGKTSIEGFRRIRPAVRKSRVTVHIVRRMGLPFLISKLWQRAAFTCGALLFIVGLYLVGSIIWFVDVRGTIGVPSSSVISAAAELGIRPGAIRSQLQAAELSRQLVLRVPELSWAGIELRGSRAIIEVVEKKLVTVDPKPIGHVIALKSGVIKKVVATSGQAVVKVGDTVTEGDVLISGVFQVDDDTEKRYVHAEGIATARVWYEGTGTSSLRRLTRERTGRTVTCEYLTLGKRTLLLHGPVVVPFDYYEAETEPLPLIWRNLGAAVEHNVVTYYELVEEYEQVSLSQAKDEALEAAMQQAQAQVPPGVTVENTIVQAELLSDQNTVYVRAVVETIEAIGGFKEISDPPGQGGN